MYIGSNCIRMRCLMTIGFLRHSSCMDIVHTPSPLSLCSFPPPSHIGWPKASLGEPCLASQSCPSVQSCFVFLCTACVEFSVNVMQAVARQCTANYFCAFVPCGAQHHRSLPSSKPCTSVQHPLKLILCTGPGKCVGTPR